jgi:hypothetical protein
MHFTLLFIATAALVAPALIRASPALAPHITGASKPCHKLNTEQKRQVFFDPSKFALVVKLDPGLENSKQGYSYSGRRNYNYQLAFDTLSLQTYSNAASAQNVFAFQKVIGSDSGLVADTVMFWLDRNDKCDINEKDVDEIDGHWSQVYKRIYQ